MTDAPTRVTPVRCHICAALIPDLPDDRRRHVADHKHTEKVIEALRRELRDAQDQARKAVEEAREIRVNLDGDISALRHQLRALEPVDTEGGLSINEWPEDEIDDDPEQESQYTDDITPPATTEDPAAGEPDEHPTDSDGYFTGPHVIER